jgi:hypothetical protein
VRTLRLDHVRGEFSTPKSKRASRAVPLIDRLAAELDGLSRTTAFGDDDDLVFAHPATGHPLDRSKLLKRFKTAMRNIGLGHRLGEGASRFIRSVTASGPRWPRRASRCARCRS